MSDRDSDRDVARYAYSSPEQVEHLLPPTRARRAIGPRASLAIVIAAWLLCGVAIALRVTT